MEEVGGAAGLLTKSASVVLVLMLLLHCACWSKVDAQQEVILQYQTKTSKPTNVRGPVPSSFRCPDGSCSFTKASDGVLTFELLNKDTNRLELRYYNEYKTGRGVFQGQVKVYPPAHTECIFQIFGGLKGGIAGDATLFILRAMNQEGGTLSYYSTKPLITNIYEKWVDVKVEHIQDESVEVFINGQSKGKWPDTDINVVNYFKLGSYHTFNTETTPYAKVQWRNVSVESS